MNKYTLLASYLILHAGIALPAIAQSTPTTPAATPAANKIEQPPCLQLAKICESANYTVNGPAGKDIWQDCVNPLLNGRTVTNITAKPEVIQACQNDINKQPCSKVLALCASAGYVGGQNKLPLFDCLIPLIQGKSIANVTPSPNDYQACKTTMDKQIQEQPCLRVMIACKSAGYSPDEVNGQVFARNCYNPILEGRAVLGVNIDTETAQACKNQSTPGTVSNSK